MTKEFGKELWQIVPKGDGYHILAINEDSQYFLLEKRQDDKVKGRLYYETQAEAQNHIDKLGDYFPEFEGSKEYVTEKFWIWDEKYLTRL